MKKYLFLSIFLLMILNAYSLGKQDTDNIRIDSTFADSPSLKSILTVESGDVPVHFGAIIHLDEGTCYIRIIRPDGETARDYNLSAPGEKRLIADFNNREGKWIIEMTSKDAKGDMKIEFNNLLPAE